MPIHHVSQSSPGLHNSVLWEINQDYNRESVVIAAGSVAAGSYMVSGTILGKITATGKYAAHNPAAVDGTEVAAAILVTPNVDASVADQKVSAIVRGPGLYCADALTQQVTLTAPQLEAVKTSFASIGLVHRNGV